MISFRKCLPSDVDVVAPLIYSSVPNKLNFIFSISEPKESLEYLRHAFVCGNGELGYKNHHAILIDDKIVGVAALWNSKQEWQFIQAGFKQTLGFYGVFKGLKVLYQAIKFQTVNRTPKENINYIGHLAIDDEYQQRGLGTLLIHHLVQISQREGFAQVALDVCIHNSRALDLYERLGFEMKDTREGGFHSKYGHIHAHHYLERLTRNKQYVSE